MRTATLRSTLASIAVAVTATACGSTSSPTGANATSTHMAISQHPSAPSTTINGERPIRARDQLVQLGDGKLHLRCAGHGPVTVLLIAGWDQGADSWGPFEGSVSEKARACAYDRFGTGTSERPTTNQTFASQAADLQTLLDAAGEPGPYVVVGHSFGGAEAVTFASKYAKEVAGLMLIDASPNTWPSVVCTVPAYQAGCDLMHNPDSDGERLDVFPAFEQVSTISSLGHLPLTVVAAAHRSPNGLTPDELSHLDQLWAEGEQRWARLSTASKVVTVDHTGHNIHIDQPQVVLDELTHLLP